MVIKVKGKNICNNNDIKDICDMNDIKTIMSKCKTYIYSKKSWDWKVEYNQI